MQLELIPAYGHQQEIAALFTEYTRMLMDGDDMMRHYLTMQSYEKELEHPEAKYGLPDGRLYLAYCDSQLAGCIALRKLDEQDRIHVWDTYMKNEVPLSERERGRSRS